MLEINQTLRMQALLVEDFALLLQRAGQKGEINPAAYDTAWVGRVNLDDNSGPTSSSAIAFPQALTWLLQHQHKDGSWGEGGATERLLSTVAAIVALTERGNRVEDAEQVERGIQFLWRALPSLNRDSSILPIGFELLIGALVEEGLKLNLNLPTWLTTHYEAYRQQKLSLLKNLSPAQFRNSTAVFSLEFLAGNLPDVPESFVDADGSVGSSPSATASLIPYITDMTVKARMLEFLKANEIVSVNSSTSGASFGFGDSDGSGSGNKGSGWGDHSRFDIFEIVWVLYNLNLAGYLTEPRLAPQVESLLDKLAVNWSTDVGVAAGTGFLPDSDDTAMAYILLKLTGRECEITPLEKYWRKAGYLATYAYERDPSTSSNIHALEAYSLAAQPGAGAGAGANKTALEERVGQLLQFVTNSRHPNRPFWLDKWHASPYYPSAHAVIATVKLDPTIVEPTIAWMLYTQYRDDIPLTNGSSSNRNGNGNIGGGSEGKGRGRGGGGWGVENPTMEETALVIQALVSYSEVRGWNERTRKAVCAGAAYLRNHYSPFEIVSPPLWIGKNRYSPELVVKSTILSALLMAQKHGL